jgi:hypothetical protein
MNLSRTALVSRDARTRPIAHWTAIEAQIPTEVLRQDPSRSPVHHEGGAGKAALPIPRRAIDWSQDHGRQSPDCRGAATALESAPRGEREVPKAAGCGLTAERDQMPGHQAASCKARARTRLTSTGTPSLLRAGCQTRPPNTSTSRTCAGARMPARPVLRPVKWALLESDLRGGSPR